MPSSLWPSHGASFAFHHCPTNLAMYQSSREPAQLQTCITPTGEFTRTTMTVVFAIIIFHTVGQIPKFASVNVDPPKTMVTLNSEYTNICCLAHTRISVQWIN